MEFNVVAKPGEADVEPEEPDEPVLETAGS